MLAYHVVSGLMYGGGQKVAIDLVSGLSRTGTVRARLVLMGNRVAPGFGHTQPDWLRVERYDGRYNRPLSLLRAAGQLRHLLQRHRPDIVHSHGWDADVIAGLARRGLPVRHIAHQHILPEWVSSPHFVHRVRRAVFRRALTGAAFVAVSDAVRRHLLRLTWLCPESVTVIRNGVDLDRFKPASCSAAGRRPTIGVAARLAPMKGVEHLIDAVGLLCQRGVECDVRIAGEGPSRNCLQEKVRDRKLTERVLFIGHQSDMPAFYRAIDLMVLPSVALEGLPLSILEAMASGLPVVSTRVSGIPEVVADGVNGRVVSPGDPAALAGALEPLLRSAALRRQMGAMGRKAAEESFSAARVLGQVVKLYERGVRAQSYRDVA